MKEYIMNRESLKRHCEAMCHRFKNIPTSGAYGEHRLVLELLEQTEWIPVNKRLPEIGDYVLCSIADHHSKHKIVISQYNREDFWSNGIIEAWMPLPKSYKAESEE